MEAEISQNENVSIFGEFIEYFIYEGIGLLFTFAALVLIVVASIKLFRGNNVPGAKLILTSLILTIFFTLISASYSIVLDIDENLIVEAILNLILGVLLFAGALGFFKLSKFTVDSCANKALNSQPSAAGTPQSGAH